MAIDTNEKRLSMLAFGDGVLLHVLPVPGVGVGVDEDDRFHMLGLFSGFGDTGVVVPGAAPPTLEVIYELVQSS